MVGMRDSAALRETRRWALIWAGFFLLASMAVLAQQAPTRAATTINVPGGYSTIQGAIDAATSGDTVLVAPGTYVEQIRFWGKAIIVESSGGPEVTIIDANRAGTTVSFIDGEGRDSVIRGFTITGGSKVKGGGVIATGSSPTIEGNLISENWSCSGAGVLLEWSSALVSGNTISGNIRRDCSGGSGGGGIYIRQDSSPEVVSNVIVDNRSTSGAGIVTSGEEQTLIAGNLIARNEAENDVGGVKLYANQGEHGSFINNLVIDNVSDKGPSQLWVQQKSDPHQGSIVVANNTVVGQPADFLGEGDIVVWVGEGHDFFNNIVASDGSGFLVWCFNIDGDMWNNNFFNSGAGQLFLGDCGDLLAVNGNVSVDPAFVDAAGGDHRLLSGSPMVDAGRAAGAPADDFDGDVRPLDGDHSGFPLPDIGAHEYIPISEGIAGIVTDGSGNGVHDVCVSVFDGGVPMGDAVTGLTGLYEVEVGAGSYTVSFEECVPGALVSEWWDDKGSQGAADGVVVSGGVVTSGIDAQLDFGVLCDGLKPTLWGTWGPDILVGTPGPDVILGLGGKDLLSGLGGADILCGGNGDDVLAGGAGDDDLFGGGWHRHGGLLERAVRGGGGPCVGCLGGR